MLQIFEDLLDYSKSVWRREKYDPLKIALQKLGDERKEVRTRASQRILKMGLPAVPELVAVLERAFKKRDANELALAKARENQQRSMENIRALMATNAGNKAVNLKGKPILLSELLSNDNLALLMNMPLAGMEDHWSSTETNACGESAALLGELAAVIPDKAPVLRLLVRALRKSPYMVQGAASKALVRFGDAAVPALLPALEHPDAEFRGRAVSVLREIGSTAPEALSALTQVLKDNNESVQLNAIQALAKAGSLSKESIPTLLNLLASKGKVPEEAKKALVSIAPADLETITCGLDSPQVETRRYSAEILKGMGPKAKAALPALYKLLADSDLNVRLQAAEAIREVGPDPAGIPCLVAALGDQYYGVSNNACHAVASIGAPAVPALADCLAHGEKTARETAARALGGMGACAAPALPNLVAALADPETKVRASAAEAVGRLGPAARQALPELVSAWNEHPEMPVAAVLGKTGAPEAVEPILKHLFTAPKGGEPQHYREALLALRPVSALNEKTIDWAVRASGFEHKYRGGNHDPGYITLDDSDEAIRCLCAVNSPVTSNLLHLVSRKRDISVTMYTGCTDPYQQKVDFQKQRDLALAELKKRGDPPYRLELYTKLPENESRLFEKQVADEQKQEKERRYHWLLEHAKHPETTQQRWDIYTELCRDHKRPEVARQLANELARYKYISPSDLQHYISLLIQVGRGLNSVDMDNAIAPIAAPWPGAYRDITVGLRNKQP